MRQYKSKSARDAQAANYGRKSYWDYLDKKAQEHYNYYLKHGNPAKAKKMLNQSLSEALAGNEGN